MMLSVTGTMHSTDSALIAKRSLVAPKPFQLKMYKVPSLEPHTTFLPRFINTTEVRSPLWYSDSSSNRRRLMLKTPIVPSPLRCTYTPCLEVVTGSDFNTTEQQGTHSQLPTHQPFTLLWVGFSWPGPQWCHWCNPRGASGPLWLSPSSYPTTKDKTRNIYIKETNKASQKYQVELSRNYTLNQF